MKNVVLDLYKIPGYNSYAKCNENDGSGAVIGFGYRDVHVSQLDVDMITADSLLLDINIGNTFQIILIYIFNFSLEIDFTTES